MNALKLMVGSYPHTEALKSGLIRSDKITLDVAEVSSAPAAFKQVVALKYDVAELSVPTFLIARAKGVPLRLLPADLFKRAKPPELVYDATRSPLTTAQLRGKRIGVAYYTATTSIWMQCLIGNAGVDPSDIDWIAVDAPLVDHFQDPANVRRISNKKLMQLLDDGDVDATVVPSAPNDSRYRTVTFEASRREPQTAFPAMESHHMLVCRTGLMEESPDAIREVWRVLLEARAAAIKPGSPDLPFGIDANRAQLNAVIEGCLKLHLIDNGPSVNELFDGLPATLPMSA